MLTVEFRRDALFSFAKEFSGQVQQEDWVERRVDPVLCSLTRIQIDQQLTSLQGYLRR
jgi:hypothetical protein